MFSEEILNAVKEMDAREHNCSVDSIKIIEINEIEPNHPDRVLKPYEYLREDGTRGMTEEHTFTHIVKTRYGSGQWGSLYGIEDNGTPWLWMD